jgi:molybdopterin-guanine dinucleotide biosynthesis protein
VAIVVVGGHTRNIGKTSVVAGIIAALPEYNWTAFKITQYGHGLCSANGEPCACETASHAVAVTEEHATASGTDSARFLQAGARRSFWVRTRQGYLAEAMPRIRKELEQTENAIFESNSILRFLQPTLYLAVLNVSIADFKPSAQYFLDRADALVHTSPPDGPTSPWPDALLHAVRGKPVFAVAPPSFTSAALMRFLAERLSAAR